MRYGTGTDLPDELDPEVAQRLEIGPQGAVVVRLDAHVVWRTARGPHDAWRELAAFLAASWGPLWRRIMVEGSCEESPRQHRGSTSRGRSRGLR
ncbi:hypothetical protein XF36_13820 [Pseudonocardia sp. HH130629-09]|nr:hypothetical protein XF36_13820 [Pseudonocardia sp. HH130629-09]